MGGRGRGGVGKGGVGKGGRRERRVRADDGACVVVTPFSVIR